VLHVAAPLAALRRPFPRIAGDEAGLVFRIASREFAIEVYCVVEYAEFILLIGPVVEVACGADLEHIVEPVEIPVGAAAAELGGQRERRMHVGFELLGGLADTAFASAVVPLHPLRFVETEDADPCGPDHVFDHAGAAVLIGIVLEPVGFVDDEHFVQAVFREVRRVKIPRRLEERLAVCRETWSGGAVSKKSSRASCRFARASSTVPPWLQTSRAGQIATNPPSST